MFGYVGLVYACMADFFIFDHHMNWLEWLGATVIICTTVTLTLHLLMKERAKKKLELAADE